MNDSECVDFLQWALPRLGLRWPGFRKVRRQVCKRIKRRCEALGLAGAAAYRARLEASSEDDEWSVLDGFCRITISRFYRDRGVFDRLRSEILPRLAEGALRRKESELRCWSIGCASGEEPYTLKLIWHLGLQLEPPPPAEASTKTDPPASTSKRKGLSVEALAKAGLACRVTATDASRQMLRRARAGRYPASSLRDLPERWREAAFSKAEDGYCLKDDFRTQIEFIRQDIRAGLPAGRFHMILCRNLVFTYFEESRQRKLLKKILLKLRSGGALVIGKTERLPCEVAGLEPWFPNLRIYRKA